MIETVNRSSAAALDGFVERHGSFLQSSLWGGVKSAWVWHGLICRDAAGEITGTMALLERRLRFLRSSLLYAPRGPVALSGESTAELLAAARKLGRERGAFLLRIDPPIGENERDKIEALLRFGFRQKTATDFTLFQARLNYRIDLTGQTPETLLLRYHPSMRRNVRLAVRGAVEICRGTFSDLPDFYAMMRQTARRSGFTPYPMQYFRDILTQMPENAALWLARSEGRAVAAAITVRFGGTASFFYGCSDASALRLHPNELLQYKMQCDAIQNGCTVFDLRGVEGEPVKTNPKYGLHRYKRKFGAELVRYAGEFDLILDPFAAALARIAQKIRTAFR